MNVRSSNAEGTDASSARSIAGRPLGKLCYRKEGRVLKVDLWVGFLEVQQRWQLAMVQGHHGFDEPSDTSCDIKVPNIGLSRSNGTELLLIGAGRERLVQSRDLNPVTKRGAGAMRTRSASTAS